MTWRTRRKLSYLMHQFNDYDLPHTIQKDQSDERTANLVVQFFFSQSELIYPAKSYFVAIVYAKLLEQYFKIPFFSGLNQNDLLIEDPWFQPYPKKKELYDKVLEQIPEDFIKLEACQKTIAYFKEEFLIGADCKDNTEV